MIKQNTYNIKQHNHKFVVKLDDCVSLNNSMIGYFINVRVGKNDLNNIIYESEYPYYHFILLDIDKERFYTEFKNGMLETIKIYKLSKDQTIELLNQFKIELNKL